MTRPETLFEAASYALNQFRERRMAERRSVPRDTADRRVEQSMDIDGLTEQPLDENAGPDTDRK